MKKKGKKLHLTAETIRRLNPATLGEAVGGINATHTDPSADSCSAYCLPTQPTSCSAGCY